VTQDQAANYADILSTLAIVGGIAFGLIQLSEYLRQRRDVIAAELMRTSTAWTSPTRKYSVGARRPLPG
jgi:hypothetical protein